MARMIEAPALWKVLRTGNLRARLRATRDGVAALRLHVAGAAIGTGVLDALAAGSATTDELARQIRVADEALLGAFLRVVASTGLVRGDKGQGPWRLTEKGRAAIDDPLVRASYEGFPGFHTALYRELGPLLAGGPPRRDIAEQGELIARLSGGFEPLVLGVLRRAVAEHAPQRVLDVGCGAALELAMMLEAAPQARGVGIDMDAGAIELASRTLADRGLAGRAQVLHSDVRDALTASDALAEPFDFALLANVLYYLPMGERAGFLRGIADRLAPGGVLFLVTTVAAPQFFSRHFDLLLQAQEGQMELSDAATLTDQLTQAGLVAGRPKPVAVGTPLVTVTATRPG
ncbi:SAM-dependent methyltransferase [Blastococcus haudaquaticus]|uniref:Methyltransferase domain-containing protein n=1 Tax=Blastococcus haudaquaticus TaxID=1938745 RepID=A0A286H0T6_9ACTN|nr:class I SAM-dependent methyltransferase [Blastococcus haudaquaticus]SOE01377.1 Methyltransferase domain-containing protein [Blastococcus haudaquaticus]